MLKKILSFFCAAVFCVLSFNAEAIVIDNRPITVGFSYFQESAMIKAMQDGAKKAAKECKAKLFFRDGRGDQDVQIAQIHDLLAQETRCLVVILTNKELESRVIESGNKDAAPTVVLSANETDKKAAYTAAYNAVKEVCAQYRAKPVPSAFYSTY